MASKRTQEDHTQADSIPTLHYAHVLRTQKTARGFDCTGLIALEALLDCVLVTLVTLVLSFQVIVQLIMFDCSFCSSVPLMELGSIHYWP